MRGLVLTFYDAALRFVTLRLQNRAGTGGRRVQFLPGSRIGGALHLDDVAGSGRRAGIFLCALLDPSDGVHARNHLANFVSFPADERAAPDVCSRYLTVGWGR
jgi:hypothetical protein